VIAVGAYRRDLRASLARLIENALDWEHLPHLHASSFSTIDLIQADDTGWSADAELPGGGRVGLDLRLDADRLGWVTTTSRDGAPVSRIDSRAEATGPDSCTVSVAFHVAEAAPEARDAIGAFFAGLYTRLYDEDEAMMMARAAALLSGAAALKTRRTVTLANGEAIEIPRACPHLGLPLDAEPDGDDIVQCPWHGYRFDVRTGRCVSGQACGWARA
jgi:nitrite reductase/ring-hydroxylating ferredoxin subunit